MKTLLLIILLTLSSNAKTFEQAFNIKTTNPKIQTKKITKSYYATTTYDERNIFEVSIRFDGFIDKLYADELYKTIKAGDKLFDIYSKEIYTLKSELESTKNFKKVQNTILQKLRLYEINDVDIKSEIGRASCRERVSALV